MLSATLSLVSGLGVVVALIANLYGLRDKAANKVGELTEMRSDIKHIRGQVDKNDVLMADVRGQIGDMKDRVTRVEESVKSAHHRINALEHVE